MKTPVATIRHLIVVVSVVAVDFGLIREFLTDDMYLPFDGWPPAFRLGSFGSALMASLVVVVGSMILPWRGDGRPFLAGFVIAGAASILLVQGVACVVPHDWLFQLVVATNAWATVLHQRCGLGPPSRLFLDVSVAGVFAGLVLLAELAIASGGGLLTRALGRAGRRHFMTPD